MLLAHTQSTFLANWAAFSGGIFESFDWSHIVCAGGAVLGCLLPGFSAVNDMKGAMFPLERSLGGCALAVCAGRLIALRLLLLLSFAFVVPFPLLAAVILLFVPSRARGCFSAHIVFAVVSLASMCALSETVHGANGFFSSDIDLFICGLEPEAAFR